MPELQQIKSSSLPLLSCEHISLKVKDKVILSDVSLSLFKGKIVTLIGPNGAGKSTLVKVLLGITKPDSGYVYKKEDLKISYLAQKTEITDSLPLTVNRLLAVGGKSTATEKLDSLAKVDALKLYDSDFHTLSGGEKQRVLLARCLLKKPDVLILDEPTQNLDFNGSAEFYQLIQKVRDFYSCSILIISHDLHLVMAKTDEVICLNHHICCKGKPEKIKDNPFYNALFPASKNIAFYEHHHDNCTCLSGDKEKQSSNRHNHKKARS